MKKIFTVHNKVELINKLFCVDDVVLDVGFWGQGKKINSDTWPHVLLKKRTKEVWGVDIEYDENLLAKDDLYRYKKEPGESFSFERKFDAVFAGDLIEHLTNPGLFLSNVKKHLNKEGRLIITTPNTFNLFLIAGKIMRFEPPINPDHTFYFNTRTLEILLGKCGFEVEEFGFVYTLDYDLKESFKKKCLNIFYKVLSFFTPKYYETVVVVAKVKNN
jgi:2-polyprenyl-3-methyl-5-hydroxy-6-metoxy-1,4-benzoquinol methylase